MTKEDFQIIRNSIPMRRVAESYGFHINKKGFMQCPFHSNGAERTPSLQIYEGCRGFVCRACGVGGDNMKFVQLYESVTPKESAILLSERFNVPISETGEVSEETRRRAQKAIFEREQELLRSRQVQADLWRLGAYIQACKSIIDRSEPFSELWCYCQDELPKTIGEWEQEFSELRKC